jgi:hypothetical protein
LPDKGISLIPLSHDVTDQKEATMCSPWCCGFFFVAAHFAGQVGFLTVRKISLGEAPVSSGYSINTFFHIAKIKARYIFFVYRSIAMT